MYLVSSGYLSVPRNSRCSQKCASPGSSSVLSKGKGRGGQRQEGGGDKRDENKSITHRTAATAETAPHAYSCQTAGAVDAGRAHVMYVILSLNITHCDLGPSGTYSTS